MAKQSTSNKHKLQNDLDSDFDLDHFIDDQSYQDTATIESDDNVKEERFDLIKNSLLVVAVITTIFLWTFDWSPRNAYSYFFGGDSPVLVFEEGTPTNVAPVLPTIPAAPRLPQADAGVAPSQNSSALDYITELRDKGLLADNKLSSFDANQLYNEDVPITYIESLDNANLLNEFSFVDISEFYNNRIPIEYLQSMEQAGYLDDFSFVDITEFYENNVPLAYLDQLNNIGVLNDLSFVEITEFYSNSVSLDYLTALEENNLLSIFSFVEVTEFYTNGVTIEFLNELRSRDLLNELSFVDIVDLFEADSN